MLLCLFLFLLCHEVSLKEPLANLNVVTVLILPLGLLPPFQAAVELSELKTLSDEGYFLQFPYLASPSHLEWHLLE